jgi:CBS domain-containing protein
VEQHWSEEISVAEYMTAPVQTIHEGERLAAAEHRMHELGVSALPVVDDTGQLGGVISLGDLLRVGRMRYRGRDRRPSLSLPDARIREHMTSPVEVTPPTATLREAASRMIRRRVHRLYVTHDRKAQGVLTMRDVMRAVRDAHVATPVGQLVRHPAVAVRSSDPLGAAIDRRVGSPQQALVVVDEGWPVGLFGAREALAARAAPASNPVEEWMTSAIVCVPPELPAHRAAARAAELGPRAILVTNGPEILGVLGGLDFATLIAG